MKRLLALWTLLGSWALALPTAVGQVDRYTAQPGDNLLAIAKGHGLAIDHLCFANNWPTNATEIWEGTEVLIPGLRILPREYPATGIVVNLPERILYRFQGGHLVGTYPCSIGHPKKSQTPCMRTSVHEKMVSPTWYPPEWHTSQKPVPPGPGNPLGDRWLGLSGRYGIHSTYDPENVGNDVTHGCIRMYPEDLRLLYPKIKVGEPVWIEYQTAKLGKDALNHFWLETFPDTYSRQDPLRRARELVKQAGFQWNLQVEKEARRCTGLPIAIEPQRRTP